MDSEDKGHELQDSLQTFPLEVSRERVEGLWKQALNHRSSARADLTAAKAKRANAEMERHRISNAALDATREACKELIAEAEQQLAMAKQAEADAEKKLEQAQMAWSEADSHREKVMAETQQEAQRIRDEARSAALQECAELKRHVTYEVQCILAEIDTLRTAAQEELEAQRIYSEAATIMAMSQEAGVQLKERVDKALRESNGADGNSTPVEKAEPWDMIGVGVLHNPEPMAETEEGMANGQHRDSVPPGKMDGAVEPKNSKKGKESSRATS